MNPLRGLFGAPQVMPWSGVPQAPVGGAGFNSMAAGSKVYGQGRPNPTSGPVSVQGQIGYNNRDAQAAARRNALIQRSGFNG